MILLSSVFATTAANDHESSYACYLDEKRDTYLGDVYSVKWMEDSDKVHNGFAFYQKVPDTTQCVSIMKYNILSRGGLVSLKKPNKTMAPTWTRKWENIFQSGNFEHTGKIREFYPKY